MDLGVERLSKNIRVRVLRAPSASDSRWPVIVGPPLALEYAKFWLSRFERMLIAQHYRRIRYGLSH